MASKIILFVFAHIAMFQTCLSALIYDTVDDVQTILQYHNYYRSVHGSSPLAWSSSLANGAAQWASQCLWQHSNAGGENLYAAIGYPEDALYADAAESWYSEVSSYDFYNPQNSVFSEVGHFTQMVWASTTQLGCARARCPGGQNSPFGSNDDWLFVVCRYSPPGNVFSSVGDGYQYFKQNVRPRAAKGTVPTDKHHHPGSVWRNNVHDH